MWSDSYDGDLRETLTLQDNVARTIAEQIRINLNAQERATLTHGKVVDPRAYEAYLKGRYFWNKRTGDDFEKAVEYFNQAIQRDPHTTRRRTVAWPTRPPCRAIGSMEIVCFCR